MMVKAAAFSSCFFSVGMPILENNVIFFVHSVEFSNETSYNL